MSTVKVKAIILDLDNTIYPVSAIGDKLFSSLFSLIKDSQEFKGNLNEIKKQIMRQAFQVVAENFSFSKGLRAKCLLLLNDLNYDAKIDPYEDYEILRNISCNKYLVTTGFTKLQHSKIKQLGIQDDFISISVLDPENSRLTKKDVFKQILSSHPYSTEEVLVIGDDLNAEIKAARELGIQSLLYNHQGKQNIESNQKTIHSYTELFSYL